MMTWDRIGRDSSAARRPSTTRCPSGTDPAARTSPAASHPLSSPMLTTALDPTSDELDRSERGELDEDVERLRIEELAGVCDLGDGARAVDLAEHEAVAGVARERDELVLRHEEARHHARRGALG